MTHDQLHFTNPVDRFESITPPKQHQEAPGLETEMTPVPDIGEHTYRGTGRLIGRKALITGGDSGIGAATAIAFAREGADVAIVHLPQEEQDAQNVARIISESGRRAVTIAGDLADASFCTDAVQQAAQALEGLDIVVLNAASQVTTEGLEDLTDEQLEHTYAVNVHSYFRVARAALAHLQPGSSIIVTTSIQAYQPSPTLLDYASTNAAVNNFSKGLAEELAPRGIRVNSVAPGPIWTVLQPTDGQPKEALPEFGKSTGLGRAGQPTELAPAFVFLASPESSYVLGATLHVNGGQPTP